MQHTLFHGQAQPLAQILIILKEIMEWAIAVLLAAAAFPLLKAAVTYFLMKLYEVFIQYQYLH